MFTEYLINCGSKTNAPPIAPVPPLVALFVTIFVTFTGLSTPLLPSGNNSLEYLLNSPCNAVIANAVGPCTNPLQIVAPLLHCVSINI